jgi:hypothetical protein
MAMPESIPKIAIAATTTSSFLFMKRLHELLLTDC